MLGSIVKAAAQHMFLGDSGIGAGRSAVDIAVIMTGSGIGVYFFFSSRRRHTRFDCDWSSDVCSSDLKRKKLSIAQTIYIINKILFPKLLYVGQLSALTKNEWEKLEQPILKFVKHQIGLASSFPTSALHHNGILGLHSLWQQFALMNVTNFIERINNLNNAASITTMLRLKQGQLNMRLSSPIFSNPHNYYRWYVNEGKGNFNIYLILLAADLGITFHSDTFNQQDFTIKGNGTPVLDLWHNSDTKFKLPIFTPDNLYPLFFAEQLIARDRQIMITWIQ